MLQINVNRQWLQDLHTYESVDKLKKKALNKHSYFMHNINIQMHRLIIELVSCKFKETSSIKKKQNLLKGQGMSY